jgi:putative glutamine amidotransferase
MRSHALVILFLVLRVITVPAQDTLLLFHPTVENLEVIRNLSEKGLLDLEGIHILGICHSGENYDYHKSLAYLDSIADDSYSLREISAGLQQDGLFKKNACSALFKALFEGSIGAIFMGGSDIPPGIYHEPTHLLTRVTDPCRHYLEVSFLFHLLGGSQDRDWIPYLRSDSSYLVRGICLGMQSMSVATGGTLIQDIPAEVYGICTAEEVLSLPDDMRHRNYSDLVHPECTEPTSYHFHRIMIREGSFLAGSNRAGGNTGPHVLSSHHQAVEDPGDAWLVSATSMDGKIIEAMEHRYFHHVAGVQFHPEKAGLFDPGILLPQSCDSMINFMEVIRGTSSYDFHLSYWKDLGSALQKLRKGTVKITRSQ